MRLGHRRTPALLAALVIFLVAAAPALSAETDEPRRAPEFSATTLAGESVVLRDNRGRLVFLSFFARWCEPCREEAPLLNELASQYPNTLRVYAIGYQESNPAELRAIAKDFGLRVPVAIDAKETLVRGYGVTGLPSGFLIDEYGYLLHSFKGISKETEAILRQSIAERSKKILSRREKGLVVFIEDFQAVAGKEDAKGTGASLSEALRTAVSQGGVSLAAKRGDASVAVEGTVSDLGPIVGVELVLRETGEGRELERSRASVIKGDTKALVKACLKALEEWK